MPHFSLILIISCFLLLYLIVMQGHYCTFLRRVWLGWPEHRMALLARVFPCTPPHAAVTQCSGEARAVSGVSRRDSMQGKGQAIGRVDVARQLRPTEASLQ